MSRLVLKLCKQSDFFSCFSCLCFPLSLELSLASFVCFWASKIIFSVPSTWHPKPKSPNRWWGSFLIMGIAIILSKLYWESKSHLYPVSGYDYLAVFTFLLISKSYPLSTQEIRRFCLALAYSPLSVFILNLTRLDFNDRNHWGFENPNWLGLYCAICLPLIFCQLVEYGKKRSKLVEFKPNQDLYPLIFLSLSLSLCCLMLVTSGSRSALYTSIFSVFIFLLTQLRYLEQLFQRCKIACSQNYQLMIAVGVSTLSLGLSAQLFLSKFLFLDRFLELNNSTNLYRIKVYQCYWDLGLSKPWWGFGLSNQSSLLCEQRLKAGAGGVNHAHNFVLQLFADCGLIITSISLAALFSLIIVPSIKFIASYNSQSHSAIDLGIHFASLNIILISLFQSAIYHFPLFPLWLGLFWGVIMVTPQKSGCVSKTRTE